MDRPKRSRLVVPIMTNIAAASQAKKPTEPAADASATTAKPATTRKAPAKSGNKPEPKAANTKLPLKAKLPIRTKPKTQAEPAIKTDSKDLASIIKTYGCTVCTTPSDLTCNSCHCATYCSQACVNADAHLHQLVCKKYDDFLAHNPRHVSQILTHKLALLLPWNSKEPEFIWIKVGTCGLISSVEDKELEKYFGEFNDEGSYEVRGRLQQYFVNAEELRDGMDPECMNQCVKHLMAGQELGDGKVFWGSMIIVNWGRNVETRKERYHDVIPGDLRWMVDHVVEKYGVRPAENGSGDGKGKGKSVGE